MIEANSGEVVRRESRGDRGVGRPLLLVLSLASMACGGGSPEGTSIVRAKGLVLVDAVIDSVPARCLLDTGADGLYLEAPIAPDRSLPQPRDKEM